MIDYSDFFNSFPELEKEPYINCDTIDAEPVVHAHWIGGDNERDDNRLHVMYCSNCKALFRYHGRKQYVNYCYKYGAKMDEEVESG